MIDFETAEMINRGLDVFHSFFPAFSLFAIIVLFESFLPHKSSFENTFDRYYTYFKLVFIFLLDSIALSQAFFGGCLIYYPQTWFNRKFLGIQEPYEFGLFGRHLIHPEYWWMLQGVYIIGFGVAVWRTWVFIVKRVPMASIGRHKKT